MRTHKESLDIQETERLDVLEKLVAWFLNSQIYNGQAYLKCYAPWKKGQVYPEITAYAISLCCKLYERRKNERFLERAQECAKYMISINKNGGIPCFFDNLSYAFDTGIFISSMFDLYAITENDVYLNEAEKSLNWLYSLWNGRQFTAVDKVPENMEWYHTPSVHLTRLVFPLLKASIYIKDKKYEKTAVELLDNYKGLQTDEGCFKLSEDSEIVMSHPHCYATEGFLYAYHILKKPEYLQVVTNSSDWLCKVQNPDGSLFRSYYVERNVGHEQSQRNMKTSDATAQATRIWKLLGLNPGGIEKAYEYLNSELHDFGLRLSKNETLTGRLFSWRRAVYSWPTFFYIHSLTLPFGQIQYCNELF